MATIKNVAKEAGVSFSTVSLVINGSKAVRESTRQRVLDTIKALHYVPNANARSLVTKKNLVLGVVRCIDKIGDSAYGFDCTVDTYLAEMLKSIEQESLRSGYSLMVDWSETYQSADQLPAMYNSGKVDGVLLVGGILSPGLPALIAAHGSPTVLAGSHSDLLACVDTCYVEAIRLAVSHLVEMGHRDIAFINGPDISQTSSQKLMGYREGLKAAGIPFREAYVRKADFSGKGGYDAMCSFWESGCHPGALIAAVDCIALGALRFLYEQHIFCPGDISVVGFEDGMLAEYAIPPLTTVSGQKQEIGRAACRLLIERILDPELPPETVMLHPQLVIRQSVRRIK